MTANIGRRRPHMSLTGPAMICPAARPTRHAVSVSCTSEAPAPRSWVSFGRAGRYMSIDSGPIALSAPRMRKTRRRSARPALCVVWSAVAVTRSPLWLRATEVTEPDRTDIPGTGPVRGWSGPRRPRRAQAVQQVGQEPVGALRRVLGRHGDRGGEAQQIRDGHLGAYGAGLLCRDEDRAGRLADLGMAAVEQVRAYVDGLFQGLHQPAFARAVRGERAHPGGQCATGGLGLQQGVRRGAQLVHLVLVDGRLD